MDNGCRPRQEGRLFFNNLKLPGSAAVLKNIYRRSSYQRCRRFQLADSGGAVSLGLWLDGKCA
ncbi:MAG: hypothetical protein GF399_11310 [Candidatus Coatesbacteria bacterium]|nr:hypothetical protein [Candidatus Coatesbacteria bacterium]